MSFLQVKNRAISTLASGITNVATSLTVASGEGALFPSTFPFHITIENEILECTARSTDTLTVTRAAESTSAAAHNAGVAVELRITAQIIAELQDAFPPWIYKTADETVNNSSTLQNDDHILLAVAANEIWAFELFLMYDGTQPGDYGLTIAFSVPTGATGFYTVISYSYIVAGRDVVTATSLITPCSYLSQSGDGGIVVKGAIINSSNAGNLQLQWAQTVAAVVNTTVKKGSYLTAHKLA